MSNFDIAKNLIEEYSKTLLKRLDRFVDADERLFSDIVYHYDYEFFGFVNALERIGYISVLNRYEFIDQFEVKLNTIDQAFHQKNGWIYIKKFKTSYLTISSTEDSLS